MKKKTGRPRIKIALDPATRERLEHVYKTSPCRKDREKAQAALLAQDGTRTYGELARIVGRCRATVFNWIASLERGGAGALLGGAPRPGRPSAMRDGRVAEALARGLAEGRWVTSGQAGAWLEAEFGIRLSGRAVRYWLGKSGGAHKVPRPVHTKKDPAAAESFKARLHEKLSSPGIPEGSRVRVWAADEARYGLHDRLRRCRGLRGVRTVKPRQQDYEWGYLFGALDVVSGESGFLVLPSVSLDLNLVFVRQIAGRDPGAHHVILWDNAGFHQRAGDAALPPNVHPLPFPAYSPELNPAERLWEAIRDAVGNRVYGVIEAMDEAVSDAAAAFCRAPEKVRRLVGDGWLHAQANAL
jgi:transposase